MKNITIQIFLAVLFSFYLCLSSDIARAQANQIPFHKLWPVTQRTLEAAAKAGKTAQSSEEYLREYENLSGTDCFDRNMAGMPQVPSMCAESKACGACYQDALRRLNFVRGQFEWLRCKYQTTRSFAHSAISFGDNVSGVHAISGLAWQAQRRQIMESLRQFGETYEEQYEEGVNTLQETLRAMGRCEAKFGGEKGWYDRFGFIYFTFMQDRYKRSSVE